MSGLTASAHPVPALVMDTSSTASSAEAPAGPTRLVDLQHATGPPVDSEPGVVRVKRPYEDT